MFCVQCGAQVGGDSKFCSGCGTAVGDRTPIAAAGSTSVQGSSPGSDARISALRHPKESLFFGAGAIVSGVAWLFLVWILLLFFWLAIPVLLLLWIVDQYFKAQMLGSSVKVTEAQYPEIHALVERHCRTLGMDRMPDVFVVNDRGATNAFAAKFLAAKYVLLNAELVDVMLAHGSTDELSSVIGHEIGHHAAGHTSLWRRLLLKPAMLLPFFGAAYSRACELTADRIGMYLCRSKEAACRGLMTLACGSAVLGPKTNLEAFKAQERELPALFGFIHDLYSSHPRLTARVLALEESAELVQRLTTDAGSGAPR